ncbi:glycine/sarcosine/betaine reductase complex component C subunit beta [Anoxynatronum buryatiense]|uniref:Betaine reductase n=1 Tax=Anoxynatronum buryatiense TaxID=489973 RepID=A0AA46AHE0_9CLOT|nr:glycine/sarcosine/betaine reductase complex component C subunit beta [Anoxynatronum buryatiense]SMP38964.1 betaine reductase [Anoxynatronum buryatiense]
MFFPVIKAEGYTLAHAAGLMARFSAVGREAVHINPTAEFMKKLPDSLRTFDEVVAYPPNQVYIGEMNPEQLRRLGTPWYEHPLSGADRYGAFGEIMPQEEFIGLVKTADVFDLIRLEKSFTSVLKKQLSKHPLFNEARIARLKEGEELESLRYLIEEQQATPLELEGKIIGCVKRGHEFDPNLSPLVIMENLATKASAVLTCLNLLDRNGIDPLDIDYVIECSENAAGDMTQRGGGNFAKAIAEAIGAGNATGSDTRAFCAAPAHAIVEAAALVQSKIYKNVLVTAGGTLAKLGMNAREHMAKDIPVLEDMVAGFAVLISENDGVNPIIRTDLIGRHTVSTGSSPQAVITSLVTMPLDKAGYKIRDIDRYSVEMQNPDITRPAGAGDVPEANYKMIAALGVKREEMEQREVATFGEQHGFPGWAPTQGHIPSGIPYIGHARQAFLNNELHRAMIVGKGSLFLARLTNQFDGISFILEKNPGEVQQENGKMISEDEVKMMIASLMRDFASKLLDDRES